MISRRPPTTTMTTKLEERRGERGVINIEHPPHVHRLLRLIREGTPAHASKASALLGRYAAACRCQSSTTRVHASSSSSASKDDGDENDSISFLNPGLIIWDLIGRLVGGDGNSGNDDDDYDDNCPGEQDYGNNITKSKRRCKTKTKNRPKKKKQRPTSGLFDPNWTTRSNCALALERVARCLPLEDRRHFFEGGDADTNDDVSYFMKETPIHHFGSDVSDGNNERKTQPTDNDSSLWINVFDLSRCTTTGKDHQVNAKLSNGDVAVSSSEKDEQPPNQLDIVVQCGRLLLSSSGESYNWDCDDEVNEYIRERLAMQNLDATAFDYSMQRKPPEDDYSGYLALRKSFLMRRVALQRQILARRLGLGGILNAPIIADVVKDDGSIMPNMVTSSSNIKRRQIIDDIVNDEDLAPRRKVGRKTDPKKVGRAKRSRKCKLEDSPRSENSAHSKNCKGISIRTLLVLESNNSEVQEDNRSCDLDRRQRRHRNPQTLLGSELAYRTFDADWTVRHGALLGTMALLRAWRVHDRLPSKSDTSTEADNTAKSESKTRKFGNWPHDILARCICVLALDSFSDFSGTSSCGDDADDADIITSGAAVAPVREMAAQIIALLLEAACSNTFLCAHKLLSQLYTGKFPRAEKLGNCGWEIRHGVLLAWNYICTMKLFHSRESGNPNTQSIMLRLVVPQHHLTLNNLIVQSIRGLSDPSDDNRAVAAQVIQQALLLEASPHCFNIVKESFLPLWHALVSTRSGVSSCAADLLQLLAELLSRRCETFVLCLEEMIESISLDSVLHKLIEFTDDDSTHVKVSCLVALSLVVKPISKTIMNGESSVKSESDLVHLQSIDGCTTALCRILSKVFETHFNPEYLYVDEKDKKESIGRALPNKRNQAWLSVVDALVLLAHSKSTSAQSIVDDCFISLILRYFDIFRTVECKDDEAMNSYRSYHLERRAARADVGECAFYFRLTSAQALAFAFAKIYSEGRPSFLSHTIGSTLVRKMRLYLKYLLPFT